MRVLDMAVANPQQLDSDRHTQREPTEPPKSLSLIRSFFLPKTQKKSSSLKMKENNNNDDTNSLSAARRTRSQAAPDWTVTESLILVNEIAAVEADCSSALSSYQQWNIIAGNCAALEVGRNMGQCRRKWDSLLSEYEKIRAWESRKSARGSYWTLKGERVRKLGLPESLDPELFRAIDGVVKGREERGEVEVESDAEAGNDVLDVTVEIGSKRKRKRSKFERHGEEKPKKCLPVESSENLSKEQDQRGCHGRMSKESHEEEHEKYDLEEEYLKDFLEEKPKLKCKAERTPKDPLKTKVELHENRNTERPKPTGVEKITISREENEETMALQLQELAVKIQAIGNESADYQAAGSQNVEDYHTEFARRQGDKLIENLGNFSNILKKLCDLLQECK